MRSEQMLAVASAMAYMHLSAALASEKHFHSRTVPYCHLFSPSAFADVVGTFVVFASKQQHTQMVVSFFCCFLSLTCTAVDFVMFCELMLRFPYIHPPKNFSNANEIHS